MSAQSNIRVREFPISRRVQRTYVHTTCCDELTNCLRRPLRSHVVELEIDQFEPIGTPHTAHSTRESPSLRQVMPKMESEFDAPIEIFLVCRT